MKKKILATTTAAILAAGGVATYDYTACSHEAGRFNCVQYVRNHDGDTATFTIPRVPEFFGKDMPVRFLGIDTPEINSKNPCEKAKAEEAQKIVHDLLQNAKRIDLIHAGKDKYFRILAEVLVDGQSVSQVMLEKKLAYPYFGETKQKVDWCKGL